MWIFIISLFLIILTHELAHLIVAKMVGCSVLVFSIGFGKPLFKKKIGDTVYQLCPILLGGYCKLKDELNYSKSKYAFTNLRYCKKLAISLAGVTTNIILGLLALLIFNILNSNINIYFLNFGIISLVLGISNLLPIPALDGSYPILVWLEKIYGKKKGYSIMQKMCQIGFILLMLLNVLFFIGFSIYLFLGRIAR